MIMSMADPPDPLPEFFDCGCSDIHHRQRAGEVECPRHSDFDVYCDAVEQHTPIHVITGYEGIP
ncbi:hypothetical protein GCM10027187_51880 [Streptosporangium sandarakinum]|uniref:hypothetical protein n=1 Tax=Streptosporangium sandarakinum TaxID=1260955 RepID=UPI0015CDB8BF|nr:hypothetical protein [Streptosporangium sandarakinum]